MVCGTSPSAQNPITISANIHGFAGQRSFSRYGNIRYSTISHESVQLTTFQKVARCGKKPCASNGVAIAPIQKSVRLRVCHSTVSMGTEISSVSR